jgi:glycosyltransferase involved in cell wall biosynthesis
MKDLVREMGFRGDVRYLPNFICVDGFRPSYGWEEESIIYFGRLSYEKGLETLIDAAKGLRVAVKIIGEGPLRDPLISKVKNEGIQNIHFLGYKVGEELNQEIRKSMFAILPSEWYENYPRSAMEAFALGKPVIGSRIGGIPELVRDGETGFIFEPGNRVDLREKVLSLLENKNKIIEMGKKARAFVERELDPDKHYRELMQIYTEAINNREERYNDLQDGLYPTMKHGHSRAFLTRSD